MKVTPESSNLAIAESLKRLVEELENTRAADPVHLARIGNAIIQIGQSTTHKAYLNMGRMEART